MDDYQVEDRSLKVNSFLQDESLEIEADFKEQLQHLIPELFRADNENFVKEINGDRVTASQLFEYFRVRLYSCLSLTLLRCTVVHRSL